MSQIRRWKQSEQVAGPDVALSAGERDGLRRVREKARAKRESALRRLGKNVPLFIVPW